MRSENGLEAAQDEKGFGSYLYFPLRQVLLSFTDSKPLHVINCRRYHSELDDFMDVWGF